LTLSGFYSNNLSSISLIPNSSPTVGEGSKSPLTLVLSIAAASERFSKHSLSLNNSTPNHSKPPECQSILESRQGMITHFTAFIFSTTSGYFRVYFHTK
ncbi:MAG: hypothetical protein AAGE92_07085, partial [Cyanobacteria bacterium P01_G01_bin.4]